MRDVGVDDSVAVVGAAAEPPACSAMSQHGVAGARLQASSLRFGEPAEEAHQHLVTFAVGIDPTTELRYPEVDSVVGQLREHQLELPAGESALRLGDDEGGPGTLGLGRV